MTTAGKEIRGQSVLIVGYGREGKSVKKWLERHDPKKIITIADRATDGQGYLAHIDGFDTVIRSPGVSPYQREIQKYVRSGGFVTSTTNIFFSLCPGITIGVTGTKGKSTTASLIAHILKGVFGDVRLAGNIGTPALDALDDATKETIFVLELSSHQLVDCRYSPHIAVLLDIVPEHLDYYPNVDEYKKAKENIYRFQKPRDYLVRGEHGSLAFATKLIGNRDNIAAAVKVARLMHVPDTMMKARVATFSPLSHRLECVGEFVGIRFYNDSLATIPQATVHALSALGSSVATLIAGGYDRGLDLYPLGTYLKNHPVATLILFPDTGRKIREAIGGDTKIKFFAVATMEEAVKLAYMHTPKGKICLLSPASASFNLFKNYEDRGNQFKEWVKKLGIL